MKFLKFTSLDNTYREAMLNKIEMHGLTHPSVLWMATEKLHGANLGVYCDGSDIKVASRTNMLEDGESFFNVWNVLGKYRENILKYTANILKDVHDFCNEAGYTLTVAPYQILFGELFGGSIQKNMPYGEEQDFNIFDTVFVFGVEDLDAVKTVFGDTGHFGKVVSYSIIEDKVVVIAKDKLGVRDNLIMYGLKYVPIVGIGTYEDVMKLTNDFVSNLTDEAYVKSFKLSEEHELLRKKAEGLVLEPVCSAFIVQDRVYLKNRSEKFQSKKCEPKKSLVQRQLEDFTPRAVFVLENIEDRLTVDRFESVISKIGEVSIRDINKVVGLMIQDAIEDFEKDELYDMDTDSIGSMVNYLENKAEVKAITKMCTFTALNLVRPLLLDM